MSDIIKGKLSAMKARRKALDDARQYATGQRAGLVYGLEQAQKHVTDIQSQIARVDEHGEKLVDEMREIDSVMSFITEVTAKDREPEKEQS